MWAYKNRARLGRMLLVEDNPGDVELFHEHLGPHAEEVPHLEVAGSLSDALRRIQEEGPFAAIVLDLNLPDSRGFDTLERVLTAASTCPVIVLTGMDDEMGLQAVAGGAADFLPKDELTGRLLVRSIRYAIERSDRRGIEARHQALVANSQDLLAILDADLILRFVSPSIKRVLGFGTAEWEHTPAVDWIHLSDRETFLAKMEHLLRDGGSIANLQFRTRNKAGEWCALEAVVQNCLTDPHLNGLVIHARDVTELRAAQHGATITARQLHQTLEALEDAVFTLDGTECLVISCNSRAADIFQTTREELLGSTLESLHRNAKEYRQYTKSWRSKIGRGVPFVDEGIMRRSGGDLFPVERTISLVDPQAGLPGGLVCVVRDITDRVEQERRVRFQAALLEQVGQPVMAVDEANRVTYWNDSIAKLTGCSSAEMEGREAMDLLMPESREMGLAIRAAVQAGETWTGELRLRTAAGTDLIMHSSVRPAVNPDGSPGGRIAAGVDVTELRRVEAERRASAERLMVQGEMLEAVGQAVIATDPEGQVTYWNRAAEALYGWSREEVLGRRVVEVIPSPDVPVRRDAIMESLRSGRTWQGEMKVTRRDGSDFDALVTNSAAIGEDGRVLGIIAVSSDITELKELQARLRQAEKMEAIGRLAGGIAHDFNNLLTAIGAHGRLLLEDLHPASSLREHVIQILHAMDRAAALTGQLLAFSRKQPVEARNVDVGRAVQDLEALLLPLIPERIALRVDAAREAVVSIDPGQLEQIVINLVVNAADAIEGVGSISVDVDRTELSSEGTALIPWHVKPGPYARLRVRDSGTGMAPQTVEHIFEPFFTTKAEGRGTGLGLSTVYGIVKQSRGHVLVDSVPGEGSLFTILLPSVGVAPDAVVEQKSPPPRSVAGGVVLLVEDDPAVRKVSRWVLERAGFSVLEAENGMAALEMAARHAANIDVVVSDVVMPQLGGVELYHRLSEKCPDLRMILVSGYSEEEVQSEIRRIGALFLAKPFRPEVLVQLVAAALDSPPNGSAADA